MTDPIEVARRARDAQRELARADAAARTAALAAVAGLLRERREALTAANRCDIDAADGLADALVRRLGLGEEKIAGLIDGVESLARDEDPVGRVVGATELDDGLVLRRVQSPIGVILVIFESRPDAVIQIGTLAIRSGNAVLLKGGSEARRSNAALVALLRDALSTAGLPPDAIAGIEGREAVGALLDRDDEIDLVIPRGSNALVRSIQEKSRIPVLGHADGICHVYLDAAADPDMARHIVLDAKCGYPAACNAVETLLVHRDWLPHLESLGGALTGKGVALRADEATRPLLAGATAATLEDWRTEYGDLTLAVRCVDSLDAAIEHIHTHGSGHTEAIVTADAGAAERFLRSVDSASVFVNASTRFADGYRYGLGAEVGISTSRIHARGPVGVEGLLTYRWLLTGEGQAAGDYGPDGRTFRHRPLE